MYVWKFHSKIPNSQIFWPSCDNTRKLKVNRSYERPKQLWNYFESRSILLNTLVCNIQIMPSHPGHLSMTSGTFRQQVSFSPTLDDFWRNVRVWLVIYFIWVDNISAYVEGKGDSNGIAFSFREECPIKSGRKRRVFQSRPMVENVCLFCCWEL